MKTCILLILVLVPQFLFSQSKIAGKVTGPNQEPLAFANVELLNVKDTTRIVAGGITDLKGIYIFQNVKPDNYLIKVVMLGYKNSTTKLTVSQNNAVKNIILKPLSTNLKEVSIKGKSINNEINKTDYYITDADKKTATSGFDILDKVPELRTDKMNETITSLDGKSVKILINGLNATVQDLIGLRPDKIIKVEYYDIPPARFAGSGFASVINIITKKSQKGGDVVVDLLNAVNAGYGNDEINLKYNVKNSQFGFYYFLGHRKFSQRVVDENFSYSLQGNHYEEKRIGLKSPFGYDQNILSFNFIHQKDSNYIFRVNVSPGYMPSNIISNYDFLYNDNDVVVSGKGKEKAFYTNFNPSTDIYFLKHLPKKQELIFDVVGNYFKNSENYQRKEVSNANEIVLLDSLIYRNTKRSVIAEAIYTKDYGKVSTSFGIRYNTGTLSEKTKNTFENSDYEMLTSEKYAYAEIIGHIKKLSYQADLGLSQNRFTDNNTPIRYSFWAFRPLIRLSYRLSKKSTITCYYREVPHIPTLNELSFNQYYIDNNIIYKGNPDLIPYNEHHYTIEYNLSLKKLSLTTQVQYYYARNIIQEAFSDSTSYFLDSYSNQGHEHYIFLSTYLNLNPFKTHWLRFEVGGNLFSDQIWLRNGARSSLLNCFVNASAFLNYKKFSLNLYYSSDYKGIINQYIVDNPGNSSVSLQYKYKNLTLSAGIWYLLSKSWHFGKRSVHSSLVDTRLTHDIYDNGRMIFFRLNYALNFGKHFQGAAKKINNEDTNTGNFQIK